MDDKLSRTYHHTQTWEELAVLDAQRILAEQPAAEKADGRGILFGARTRRRRKEVTMPKTTTTTATKIDPKTHGTIHWCSCGTMPASSGEHKQWYDISVDHEGQL